MYTFFIDGWSTEDSRIMVDTDNTGSYAVARFSDIYFSEEQLEGALYRIQATMVNDLRPDPPVPGNL